MSLPALFELARDYRQLEALSPDEELPAEVIRDTLEALTGDIQDKSVNVAKFVLGLEAEAATIEEAAKAMLERAARRKKRAEAIRNYLLFCLQSTGISKVSCPYFTLSVRRNPEAVEIEDQSKLPAEFMVQPEPPPARPDKSAIKAALKAGRHVPGCYLRTGERLEIRS